LVRVSGAGAIPLSGKSESKNRRCADATPVADPVQRMEVRTMKWKTVSGFFGRAQLVLMLALPIPGFADAPDDTEALKGLSFARAVFDITTASPKQLNFYLQLIDETANSMHAQGVKTHFVLAFRGPASVYTSTDSKNTKIENWHAIEKISDRLADLGNKKGVELTQCAIAAKANGVDTRTLNPAVKLIGNSWISLIAYQNKGYAIIPIR
jgi:intracellular sulfur oxidation DsrE/DsrF family protein